MKKNVFPILFFALFWTACDDEIENKDAKDLLLVVTKVFCQHNPNVLVQEMTYTYDDLHNLIKETLFIEDTVHLSTYKSATYYDYNEEQVLIREFMDGPYLDREKIYHYNTDKQIDKIVYTFSYYNVAGELTNEEVSEELYEYENGFLSKLTEYWGGSSIYEYDEQEQLFKKSDFTQNNELSHITFYEYSEGLLSSEKIESFDGTVQHEKSYLYDEEDNLLKIIEDGNVVEENIYEEHQLMEKRLYYFGIDPGFDMCLGNYIYKYEYE